jgi:hypothetical protein
MNPIDVSRELATDEQCLAFLEKQRWPDGSFRDMGDVTENPTFQEQSIQSTM